ncbi:MAG: hypothetical protein JWM33_309, partial [Caulobacteraceae bacterium]|nr:hypothetical protein [Caulobacteraceae bacterium]
MKNPDSDAIVEVLRRLVRRALAPRRIRPAAGLAPAASAFLLILGQGAVAQPAADVSGAWSGALAFTLPDGGVVHDTA